MKNKNGLEYALRYAASAIIGIGAGVAIGAITPNYAYAEDKPAKQEQSVDMKSDVKGKKCHKVDVCEDETPNVEPKPAPKKEPKKKTPKKTPKKEPVDGGKCKYDTVLKTVGAKSEVVPLYNNYGEEAVCTYRAADLNESQEYMLTASGNRYFTKKPIVDNKDNVKFLKMFYDAQNHLKGVVFRANGDFMLQYVFDGNDVEDLEGKVKKAEAKKEEPKKEDFTPLPTPKKEEPKKEASVVEEESEESKLAENLDFAAEATMGFMQNTQDLSGSQVNYSGLRTGVIVVPSLKLSEHASLGVYGKYAHTNFMKVDVNGSSTEGSKAYEHEFGSGLVLNIKGSKDKSSHAGDLNVVFGGGYLGRIQQMDYMGYSFEQNQNGGDFMLAVNAPKLFYADSDNGFGLEGAINGRVLRTKQDGPAGSYDRGTRVDFKGNAALNLTLANAVKLKAGVGGTSMDSLLPDAGRRNGSHLLVGIGSPDGYDGVGWAVEGTFPYGVDNDEWGAEALVKLGRFTLGAEGKMYVMPTATGNGDSAGNQSAFIGVTAGYSTDFDMLLVKGLKKIFGGN